MYRNVEEVLKDVYKIRGERMEPINGTALVCALCESKGVIGGGGDLTQAEKHAHAVMIISKIERVLNRYELALVECKYSADWSGIVDITAYIEQQNEGVNLLICDALVSNILREVPKQVEIMDKYDLSKGTVWAHRKKVSSIIAQLEESMLRKLDDEFRACGIIESRRDVAFV